MFLRKNAKRMLAFVSLCGLIFLAACSSGQNDSVPPAPEKASGGEAYHKIDAAAAKEMIDAEDPAVTIVNVRTEEEYAEGHLPGALLLPLDTVEKDAPAVLPDQDAALIIYCRSGRRSKEASDKLTAMGYQNVYDMGGIIDWPYDTESTQ